MHSKKQHEANPDQQQQQLHSSSNAQPTQEQETEKPPAEPQQFSFGSSPISIKCPFCHARVKTEIIMKPELISIMLGLVMFTFVPNAIMIILVVIVLQVSATKRHRCPLCERQLGTDGKFLLFFKDKVYSFSLGQNGVLISKKILITVGLFILMIVGIYIKATIVHRHEWIDLSWNQLVEKCPKVAYVSHCNDANLDKTIKNWKGYVMRVQDRRDSLRRYYDYALQIYVKMQPTQTDKKQPDIYLTSSSSKLYDISEVLDNLTHGDQIVFNATFYPAGRGIPTEAQDRHLQIVDLNKTGNHRDDIDVYMNKKEEEYFGERIEGSALRKQKQ